MVALLLATVAVLPICAAAQTPAPAPAAISFEGITLGEPMAGLKPRIGDPVRVVQAGHSVIWRYLQGNGGIYLDVLVRNDAAYSVTVVQRFQGVAYTDPNGISFGMSADQVRARLGPPTRTSTNADDGSVDLWYRVGEYAWIYELYSDRLGFIQLVASRSVQQGFVPGPPTVPSAGTSLDSAIWIRPSSPLANATWIDTYLAMNSCGNNGHWTQTSSNLKPDTAKNDPVTYMVVRARCTDGGAERDFYFDTRGASPAPSPQASPPRRVFASADPI